MAYVASGWLVVDSASGYTGGLIRACLLRPIIVRECPRRSRRTSRRRRTPASATVDRLYAARNADGRPERMTAGCATAVTSGTRLIPAASVPVASISGPKQPVWPVGNGLCTPIVRLVA